MISWALLEIIDKLILYLIWNAWQKVKKSKKSKKVGKTEKSWEKLEKGIVGNHRKVKAVSNDE